MTKKLLGFEAFPSVAVVAGDTTPNPGMLGVLALSTSLNTVVFWNGASWESTAANLSVVGVGGATTLVVPEVANRYAEVFYETQGQEAATPTSKVLVNFAGRRDAENDIESLADNGMQVFAVPVSGGITFVLTANGFFTGPFDINFEVFT